ncbi:MAG: hypothetical protein JOZ21_01810 [Verrucomicrobia bacterium]|nr:hypothetical protein [Verrucomicrobiota bacterium]
METVQRRPDSGWLTRLDSDNFCHKMSKPVIEVQTLGVAATSSGYLATQVNHE